MLSPQLSVQDDESKCTIVYAALYAWQKTWVPKEILVSDWSISKNLLLWYRFAQLAATY
jgi:hypothetical protein